jgi:hypothetical protein
LPKEVLLTIINKGLFLQLVIIIVVYSLNSLTLIKLGLFFAGIKIKAKKILPWTLVMTLYCLFAKQFISAPVAGLGGVILCAILLKFIGKITIPKATMATFFVELASIIGTISINQPIYIFNKKTMEFLLATPLGVAIGTITEFWLPALVLIIFSRYNILSLPFSEKKVTKLDYLGIVILGFLLLSLYNLMIVFLIFLKLVSNNHLILILIMVFEFTVTIGTIIMFFFFFIQKQRQQEKYNFLLQHSKRLITTLASEHREFRNRLQVIQMMGITGKSEDLTEYIYKLADEMSQSKRVAVENPVLVAALISQKILAKEKGVELQVFSDASLNSLTNDLDQLGEVINIALDLFIENEVNSRSEAKMVFLDIRETDEAYLFEFNNSEEAVRNLQSNKIKNYKWTQALEHRQEALSRFKVIGELVKELGGKPEYILKGDCIVQFKLKIKKLN